MKLPDYPSPNQPVKVAWGHQVVDYLRSITLRPGAGYTVTQGPGGTTLALRGGLSPARAYGEQGPPFFRGSITRRLFDIVDLNQSDKTFAIEGSGSDVAGARFGGTRLEWGDPVGCTWDADESVWRVTGLLASTLTTRVYLKVVIDEDPEERLAHMVVSKDPMPQVDDTGYTQYVPLWLVRKTYGGPITLPLVDLRDEHNIPQMA